MDETDLGEAADYILAERRKLAEDHVWAVLTTLGEPPAKASDALALDLVARSHPGVPRRAAKLILKEWRAYAALAAEDDWEDEG